MKISVAWEHAAEDEGNLERWTAEFESVQLRIVKSPNSDGSNCFVWANTRAGENWRTGNEDTLETAMLFAIKSVSLTKNGD